LEFHVRELSLAEKDSGAADPLTTDQFLPGDYSSTASWLQGPARYRYAEHNGRASRVLRVTAKRKRGERIWWVRINRLLKALTG
jgi:hypothetical protein